MKAHITGYCFSSGGPLTDGAHAPIIITSDMEQVSHENCDFLYPSQETKLANIVDLNTKLAQLTHLQLTNGHFPITIGGDHSCAIGTWSGVSDFARGAIGLIYIDAHLDAHTPKTSESQNIHGMSVGHLLGKGYQELAQICHRSPKINPKNTVYIGTRDYEAAEMELIKSLNITIFTCKDVQEMGIETVLQKAYEIASSNPNGYGISIDIDAFDPLDAPGVSNPSPNGLDFDAFHQAWQALAWPKRPMAFEICEYMPQLDSNNQTLTCVRKLCEKFTLPTN